MTMRIIVIDDDPIILQGLALGLRRQGHHVEAYQDAVAGEQMLQPAQQWDVVVLDLAMPGRSGLEILQAMPPDLVARTVVCSATTDPAVIAQVRQVGVAQYLKKPLRLADLLAALKPIGERTA
ncbi:MAG: response regulator [Chloroflexi bacterium]|nr:response regulator [Chloroflexota bacterium]MBU1750414.1 response regulator [Chloroflexota bacterium]